ncbi:hypothetical protein HPB50_022176 [Hyalomma asiaticum]|uniref:Uncharacterized protein n=1 Tax=Hyalomma asiaticum TaxID=266040 RepID=A0ACB7RVQ0_HYAAI|nr:hypothetical protein HPB50_022176 [Hyalomma asiaticum]
MPSPRTTFEPSATATNASARVSSALRTAMESVFRRKRPLNGAAANSIAKQTSANATNSIPRRSTGNQKEDCPAVRSPSLESPSEANQNAQLAQVLCAMVSTHENLPMPTRIAPATTVASTTFPPGARFPRVPFMYIRGPWMSVAGRHPEPRMAPGFDPRMPRAAQFSESQMLTETGVLHNQRFPSHVPGTSAASSAAPINKDFTESSHHAPAQHIQPPPEAEPDEIRVTSPPHPSSEMVHAAPESQTQTTLADLLTEIPIHPHVLEMVDVATEVNESELLRVHTLTVAEHHSQSQNGKVSVATQTIPNLLQETGESPLSLAMARAGPEVRDTKTTTPDALPDKVQQLGPAEIANVPLEASGTAPIRPKVLGGSGPQQSVVANEAPQYGGMPPAKPNALPLAPQHAPSSEMTNVTARGSEIPPASPEMLPIRGQHPPPLAVSTGPPQGGGMNSVRPNTLPVKTWHQQSSENVNGTMHAIAVRQIRPDTMVRDQPPSTVPIAVPGMQPVFPNGLAARAQCQPSSEIANKSTELGEVRPIIPYMLPRGQVPPPPTVPTAVPGMQPIVPNGIPIRYQRQPSPEIANKGAEAGQVRPIFPDMLVRGRGLPPSSGFGAVPGMQPVVHHGPPVRAQHLLSSEVANKGTGVGGVRPIRPDMLVRGQHPPQSAVPIELPGMEPIAPNVLPAISPCKPSSEIAGAALEAGKMQPTNLDTQVRGQCPLSSASSNGPPQLGQIQPITPSRPSLCLMPVPSDAKISATQVTGETGLSKPDSPSSTDHGAAHSAVGKEGAQLGEIQHIPPDATQTSAHPPSSERVSATQEASEIHPRPEPLPEKQQRPPPTTIVDGAPQLGGNSAVPYAREGLPTAEEVRGRLVARPDMVPIGAQPPGAANATPQKSVVPPALIAPLSLKPQHPAPAVAEHAPLGLQASGHDAPRPTSLEVAAHPPGLPNMNDDALTEPTSATSLLEAMSNFLKLPPEIMQDSIQETLQTTVQQPPTNHSAVPRQVTDVVPGLQLSADQQTHQSSAATSHLADSARNDAGVTQLPLDCKGQTCGKETDEEFRTKIASALTATAAAPSPAAPSPTACRPMLTADKRHLPEAFIITHEEEAAKQVSLQGAIEQRDTVHGAAAPSPAAPSAAACRPILTADKRLLTEAFITAHEEESAKELSPLGASDERDSVHLYKTTDSEPTKRASSDDRVAVELEPENATEIETEYAVPEMRPLVASFHHDKGRRSTGIMSPSSPIEIPPASKAETPYNEAPATRPLVASFCEYKGRRSTGIVSPSSPFEALPTVEAPPEELHATSPAVPSKEVEKDTKKQKMKVRPLVASFGQGLGSPSRSLSHASSPNRGFFSPSVTSPASPRVAFSKEITVKPRPAYREIQASASPNAGTSLKVVASTMSPSPGMSQVNAPFAVTVLPNSVSGGASPYAPNVCTKSRSGKLPIYRSLIASVGRPRSTTATPAFSPQSHEHEEIVTERREPQSTSLKSSTTNNAKESSTNAALAGHANEGKTLNLSSGQAAAVVHTSESKTSVKGPLQKPEATDHLSTSKGTPPKDPSVNASPAGPPTESKIPARELPVKPAPTVHISASHLAPSEPSVGAAPAGRASGSGTPPPKESSIKAAATGHTTEGKIPAPNESPVKASPAELSTSSNPLKEPVVGHDNGSKAQGIVSETPKSTDNIPEKPVVTGEFKNGAHGEVHPEGRPSLPEKTQQSSEARNGVAAIATSAPTGHAITIANVENPPTAQPPKISDQRTVVEGEAKLPKIFFPKDAGIGSESTASLPQAPVDRKRPSSLCREKLEKNGECCKQLALECTAGTNKEPAPTLGATAGTEVLHKVTKSPPTRNAESIFVFAGTEGEAKLPKVFPAVAAGKGQEKQKPSEAKTSGIPKTKVSEKGTPSPSANAQPQKPPAHLKESEPPSAKSRLALSGAGEASQQLGEHGVTHRAAEGSSMVKLSEMPENDIMCEFPEFRQYTAMFQSPTNVSPAEVASTVAQLEQGEPKEKKHKSKKCKGSSVAGTVPDLMTPPEAKKIDELGPETKATGAADAAPERSNQAPRDPIAENEEYGYMACCLTVLFVLAVMLLLVGLVRAVGMTWTPTATNTTAATHAVFSSSAATAGLSFCSSDLCNREADYVKSLLDSSTTEPCENFYEHICGSWSTVHPLGENKGTGATISTDTIIQDHLVDTMLTLLPSNKESDVNLAVSLYNECADRSKESMAIASVVRLLGSWAIKQWPREAAATMRESWTFAGQIMRDLGLATFLDVTNGAGPGEAPVVELAKPKHIFCCNDASRPAVMMQFRGALSDTASLFTQKPGCRAY